MIINFFLEVSEKRQQMVEKFQNHAVFSGIGNEYDICRGFFGESALSTLNVESVMVETFL